MKIKRLSIDNFKAIRSITLDDLTDTVLIAGPNGCGKTCIFDAIRLLKSMCGGYQGPNEWHSFFSEFQINIQRLDEVQRVFQDKTKSVRIEADFLLTESERTHIAATCRRKIYEQLWTQHIGGEVRLLDDSLLGEDMVRHTEQISAAADRERDRVIDSLKSPVFRVLANITPDLSMNVDVPPALAYAFRIFDPEHIGVIDYHSSHRTYQRQRLSQLQVNLQDASQKLASQSLYNWQQKYNNVKTELASAYVKDLLIKEAVQAEAPPSTTIETVKEMFTLFLKDKIFAGPKPSAKGELDFPVTIGSNIEHDIDDLSSGEKELVYGYLHLRNLSARNSIILLDEPELHLNPRLISGLPSFYKKHLGEDLGNQLWMVTHSDAFLRDAFHRGGFSMYHMTPSSASSSEQQAVPISSYSAVDRAVIDLVGDVAGYRPGQTIVLFESTEAASFDASVTLRLFPELVDKINAISGENRFGVMQLYSALERAVSQASLPFKVFAIVDKDLEGAKVPPGSRLLIWDVYHIENYLLSPSHIARVMRDFPTYALQMSESDVDEKLRTCAAETLDSLVEHQLTVYIDLKLKQCLDLGFDRAKLDPVAGLSGGVLRVYDRIGRKVNSELSSEYLGTHAGSVRLGLQQSLADGTWRSKFRGRDILKRFAGMYLTKLPYEAFRDAIVARMADSGFKPAGMRDVLDPILREVGAKP